MGWGGVLEDEEAIVWWQILQLHQSVFYGKQRKTHAAFYMQLFKQRISVAVYGFRTQVHFCGYFIIGILTAGQL